VSSPMPEPAPLEQREHVTYGEVYQRGVAMGAWLRKKGIRCGDRVGLVAGNCTG
jgi:acyl-CoA synthetase (AMP-forming)/AMP-acid ligase II